MKINKDSLKARANNVSKQYNIGQNIIYARFFFDAFLARLAASQYKDKFVLKGGLYLSSVVGIDNRATVDIDFLMKKIAIIKENIIGVVSEIISIDIGDEIFFDIVDLCDIRLEDEYGGLQIKLIGKLDNIKFPFSIDIATGDPIVPSEIKYDYACLMDNKFLSLNAYSLESVIAEKIETVLNRGISNSRSKDFYDLYMLYKTQLGKIDVHFLKEAYIQTCKHRKFDISKKDAIELLQVLGDNTQLKIRWNAFSKRNNYANKIEFENVIASIMEWINFIY